MKWKLNSDTIKKSELTFIFVLDATICFTLVVLKERNVLKSWMVLGFSVLRNVN